MCVCVMSAKYAFSKSLKEVRKDISETKKWDAKLIYIFSFDFISVKRANLRLD